MPNPPSGMKITKNGVTYKSNIDRTTEPRRFA